MKIRMQSCLLISFLVFVLVLSTSCTEKRVKPVPDANNDESALIDQERAEKDRQEAIAEQRALEEEKQRQEQIRIEEEKAAALERERLAAEAARKQFMSEDIYFDYNSHSITETAKSKLALKAEWLQENSGVSVTIEGHCDERGSAEYNMELGKKRSETIELYITSLGVDSSRIKSISYGENQPVDTSHNEEAWAMNRRAHFAID